MRIDFHQMWSTLSSFFAAHPNLPASTLWSQQGSYPPRSGNEVEIFIDGQAAYRDIATAFRRARKFIYLTISFGAPDFLLAPETGETFFDILRSCRKNSIDVRMVVWEPATKTADTIPDPAPATISGVNDGPGSIQARWDKAKGYHQWYRSPHGHFEPVYLDFPALLGCHHQKTYVMDDSAGGVVAFVGGINPVQSYWDTPAHDVLDPRRVARGQDLLKGLEGTPPLHDIFYRIKGPAVADVAANFVERYNGASIPAAGVAENVPAPVTAEQIPPVPNGIDVQVLRTIAPETYATTPKGDTGIRDVYLNALGAAGQGSLVYIENQYFFDHGVISEIHEAAERGAKVIAILTSKPDENTLTGFVERGLLERISNFQAESRLVQGHRNVAILTLGNHTPDPRAAGKVINSETYIHSKNMAVFGGEWAVMTGGSANIAFTSMRFHSEMNIAFTDRARIKQWVAQLWSEHLGIPAAQASDLIEKPEDAFNFFKNQADHNQRVALANGETPVGRIFYKNTEFPPRELAGITVAPVAPIVAKATPATGP